MDFLLDVHLPITLSKFLNRQPGCTSTHVNQILNRWHTTDMEISKYADQNKLVVVTKDEDFKNSHFIRKSPKKLIKIALGNISNADLILLFEKYLYYLVPLAADTNFYIEIGRDQINIIN